MSKFSSAFKSVSFMIQDQCDVLVSLSDSGRGDLRCDFQVTGDRDFALKGFHCDLRDPDLAKGSRIDGDRLTGRKCGEDRDGEFSRDRHHKRHEDRDHDRDGDPDHHRDADRDHHREDRHNHDDTDRDCGARFEDDGGHGCRSGSFTLSHDECALSVEDLCGTDFEIVICDSHTGDETVLTGETPEEAEAAAEDAEFAQDDQEEVADEVADEAEDDDTDQGDADDAQSGTEDDVDLPLIDATEEELAAMSQAGDHADEMAQLPIFLL